MDFTEFAVGDIGFHFGNQTQALKRANKKGKGRIIGAYLNIKNPLNFGIWILYLKMILKRSISYQ